MLQPTAGLAHRSPWAPTQVPKLEKGKWSLSPQEVSGDSDARYPPSLGVTSPTRQVFTRNMNNIFRLFHRGWETLYSGFSSGKGSPDLTISTPLANNRWKVSSVMIVARLVAILRLQITVTIELSSPHFSIQTPARLPHETKLTPNEAIMQFFSRCSSMELEPYHWRTCRDMSHARSLLTE